MLRNASSRSRRPSLTARSGLHTLRHTAATILFRRGWNAVQVQKFLGHHSPAFTLATYVHLLDDDLPDPTFLDDLGATDRGHSGATGEGEIGRDRIAAVGGV